LSRNNRLQHLLAILARNSKIVVYCRIQKNKTMANKIKWGLFIVTLVAFTACASGGRSGKNCGCPQKSGMVGY
jgi:hypothetical protein